MSKKIQYPNGYVGVVNDKVAEILSKRKGHRIVGVVQPQPEKPSDDAKEQSKA